MAGKLGVRCKRIIGGGVCPSRQVRCYNYCLGKILGEIFPCFPLFYEKYDLPYSFKLLQYIPTLKKI